MRSGRAGAAVTVAVAGYALGMALVAVIIATAGDSNALGMLLLFGPRWLLVFPWLLLVPLAFLRSRGVILTSVVGTLVTLFWVSGFEVPVPSAIWRGAEAGKSLRIVTYNTDRSVSLASRIAADVLTWDADLVVLQDCSAEVGDVLTQAAATSPGRGPYQIHMDAEFCVVSRFPIRSLERKERVLGSREDGRVLRFAFEWERVPVSMATVHLPSPRDALGAARHGNFELLEQSVRVRSSASRAMAKWIRESATPGAVIIAGDFNVPSEAQLFREDWSLLRNAFSEAGWGVGHTMFAGHHRVRIDHVLVSREFTVRRARVLSGYPSEHQPVVVDLSLATP